MKRNFNKEFKEEFKKSFDNGLNKDTLKENLNLVPQEDTIIFKKKPFYGLSSLFAALLIIVTASITFLVTYYAEYDENSQFYAGEDLNVIEFYQNMYEESKITFICKTNVSNDLSLSFVKINYDNRVILGVYFHKSIDNHYGLYSYAISINELTINEKIKESNNHVEYILDIAEEYSLDFSIYYSNQKLFSFYTKI